MPQMEESGGPVDVVFQAGEGHDVEPVAPGRLQFLPERGREVHVEFRHLVVVPHLSE